MAPPGIGDQKSAIGKKPARPITDYRSLKVVGLGRFELPTSRLSSARSNQLSYKPLGQETVISGQKSVTADHRRARSPITDFRSLIGLVREERET
jgi:hypothetical protein